MNDEDLRGVWEIDDEFDPAQASALKPLGTFELPGGFLLEVSGPAGQALNLSPGDLAALGQWLAMRSAAAGETGFDDLENWNPLDIDVPPEEPDTEPPEDDRPLDPCDWILLYPGDVRGPFMSKREANEYRRRLPPEYFDRVACDGLWYLIARN